MGPDDPVTQNRANGAVYVTDRHLEGSLLTGADAVGNLVDDLPVQVVLEHIRLRLNPPKSTTVGSVRPGQDQREVQVLAFPMVDGLAETEPGDLADHVVERLEAQFGHDPAHFLGYEKHELLKVLRPAGETFAQFRILRANTDRTRAQVTLSHQHAAQAHQGGSAKTKSLRAEQCSDDHVASGLELSVHLHPDAISQAVEYESLLRLSQAQLPGNPGVLDGRKRTCARSAIVA